MLYLPPHFAHHCVALNDCKTFSIGFRAPTQLEMLDALIQTLTEQGGGQQRYRDPGLQVAEDDKLIDAAALSRFKQSLMNVIEQSDDWISDAVGRLMTETKPSLQWLADLTSSEAMDETGISEKMLAGERLVRNSYIRLAWLETETDFRVYAAGESVSIDKQATEALAMLSGDKPIALEELKALREQPSALAALCSLLGLGAWHWEELES
jgi:50S ribosomal protein L16 3-hydroxylase